MDSQLPGTSGTLSSGHFPIFSIIPMTPLGLAKTDKMAICWNAGRMNGMQQGNYNDYLWDLSPCLPEPENKLSFLKDSEELLVGFIRQKPQ